MYCKTDPLPDLDSNQDGPPVLKLNEPGQERSDSGGANSPPTLNIISPPSSSNTNENDKSGMFFLFVMKLNLKFRDLKG